MKLLMTTQLVPEIIEPALDNLAEQSSKKSKGIAKVKWHKKSKGKYIVDVDYPNENRVSNWILKKAYTDGLHNKDPKGKVEIIK